MLIFKEKRGEGGILGTFSIFSIHPFGAIMRHLKLCYKYNKWGNSIFHAKFSQNNTIKYYLLFLDLAYVQCKGQRKSLSRIKTKVILAKRVSHWKWWVPHRVPRLTDSSHDSLF